MVVGKMVAHLCLTLIIILKFSIEHDRLVTTLNIIFSVVILNIIFSVVTLNIIFSVHHLCYLVSRTLFAKGLN
jgi:hypothetical protein